MIILGDFNLGPDEEGRNQENYKHRNLMKKKTALVWSFLQ